MTCQCPYCGQVTDRPVIFPRVCQKIFSFIWDNPHCTTKEIREWTWSGMQLPSNQTLNNHLVAIREGLERTEYRLVRVLGCKDEPHKPGPKFRYKIVARKMPIVDEGFVNPDDNELAGN